jgi:hypothetical protein
MTTPKCVFGVFSTGTFGGADTTGAFEGFRLDEVVFSEGKQETLTMQDPLPTIVKIMGTTLQTGYYKNPLYCYHLAWQKTWVIRNGIFMDGTIAV